MSCIILKNSKGEERQVIADGITQYQKAIDEEIVGVSRNCDDTIRRIRPTDEGIQLLNQLDKEVGAGPGDWIKRFANPIAKLLGRGGCTSCEARRIVTNAYEKLKEKHGQVEALKIVSELWHLSFSGSSTDVLNKLKEYLQ